MPGPIRRHPTGHGDHGVDCRSDVLVGPTTVVVRPADGDEPVGRETAVGTRGCGGGRGCPRHRHRPRRACRYPAYGSSRLIGMTTSASCTHDPISIISAGSVDGLLWRHFVEMLGRRARVRAGCGHLGAVWSATPWAAMSLR